MKPLSIVVYCGLLMSISAFAVDISLPTFAAIADDLAAPYELVQWTITIYMFSAGIAQLVWGSASDRFGRKPALAWGLSIFLGGCVLATLAPNIGLLLAARALQGFGAAAAIVCSRAIIRDRHSGPDLARNLALATAIFAVGPIVAPLLGAGIALPFGWRAVFVILGLIAIGLLFVLLRLPETVPALSPDALKPSVFAARTRRLFAHPQSRYFLVISAVIMSAMMLILTTLPRIYDTSFGVTGVAFALLFALHGFGIIIGQTANRRLIPRLGVVPTMLLANSVLIVAAGAMLAVTLAGLASAYVFTALAILFATSYLIVFSNAAALVMDPHGDIAGFTAAFYGFSSQIGSAIVASLLVFLVGDDIVRFPAALLGICLVSFLAIFRWHQRHRR
ncbi:multidrug effflux MFS transporter [Aquamicrobium sp. LC103]|uniref:multidrug effflux MFS transporter n=1 Tax=Aquamicrobium sp. LC103 TaxID=1120658 RepID=UPI00148583BD|nr:multidrug effflux MFS transporter [Aquamicrobium sp. LC103]